MVRTCLLLFVALTGLAVAKAQFGVSALLPCPPLKQQAPGCKNFCKAEAPGTVGKYYCCDEDRSPDNHPGTCPRTPLEPFEVEIMCDPNDPNRPNSLNCKRDADCHPWEKCCYTPVSQLHICRQAIYA